MSAIEVIAVSMTLLGIALTIRQQVSCWPVGIVGILAYLVVFIRARLYADSALQLVFIAQSIYGWWYWTRGGRQEGSDTPISMLRWPARATVLAATATAALVVGAALSRWTDAAAPYADATLSAGSLTANWLLARKVLENWLLWIGVNVGYVVLFWRKGLVLSSGLYVVLLGLAIAGLVEWRRDYARQKQPLASQY